MNDFVFTDLSKANQMSTVLPPPELCLEVLLKHIKEVQSPVCAHLEDSDLQLQKPRQYQLGSQLKHHISTHILL